MRNQNVIVSTTSTFQGWDIQEYLGPISSHVVAGTSIFSDAFAGLSDIFGGRYLSYQKQLTSIHDESIELLKNKACSLGANGILGLRIDHDEISGKGKSMFMVTAVGTAVKINPVSVKSHSINENTNQIDSENLTILLRKMEVIDDFENQELVLDDETWNFVIRNQIQEIYPGILNYLHELDKKQFTTGEDNQFKNLSKEFFLNLPEETTKEILYNSILKGEIDIFSFAETVINEGKLLDFEQVIKLLDSNDFELQKKALVLLQYDKIYYSHSDIEHLAEIYNKIKTVFNDRSKHIEEKSKLSSNIKEKWICQCGSKNDQRDEYCSNCHKDMYGFKESEVNSLEILELLKNKLVILKSHFSNS